MFEFKHKKIFTIIFSLLFFGGLFFVYDFSLAQTVSNTFQGGIDAVDQNIALGGSDLRIIITRIINVLLGLLGIIMFGVVAYGGFLWMTAGGNDEQISTAKKFIINGVIGLAIVLSSWAIAKFVLTRLGWATNTGQIIGEEEPGPGPSDYCDIYPESCLFETKFLVKSITPNTLNDNEIEMHNVVVRVIFSHKLNTGLDADEIFDIKTNDGQKANEKFNFRSIANGYGVEANPKEDFTVCDSKDSEDIYCLPSGKYFVEVKNNLEDINGNKLESSDDYPKESSFKLSNWQNTPILDSIVPEFDFKINGTKNNLQISKSSAANISVDERDNKSNSYFVFKTYKKNEPENAVVRYVDGPRLNKSSSAEYNYSFPFEIPSSFEYNTVYVAEITVYDSDHNLSMKTLEFRVSPDYCFDGDVSNDDNYCGSGEGASCLRTSDCNAGLHLKCIDTNNNECNGSGSCTCERWPYIESIEQDNGKSGNWVTIYGYNFGDAVGTIKFGNINAVLAPCSGNDVWNNNWIVVEVPEKTLSENEVDLFLETSDKKSETSNDLFGPTLKFTYNNIERPGLCSVLTADANNQATSTPKTLIHSIGKSFGSEIGNLIFGNNYKSGIRNWNNTEIYSFVPFLEAGKYSVSAEAKGGEKSNTIPFNILKTEEDQTPFIASVDPTSTTPKSYITINGKNFGFAKGQVKIILSDGREFSTDDLPVECGENVWTDTQIITKVPSTSGTGLFGLKIIRGDGENLTSNVVNFEILEGKPNPSICNIIPNSGNAPLLGNNNFIFLIGENFKHQNTGSETVYFWNYKAQENDLNTWLKTKLNVSSNGYILGMKCPGFATGNFSGSDITNPDLCIIKTNIPFSSDLGFSMATGPIKVNSLLSNGFTYNVNSCLVSNYELPSGFKCCAEGPEAGLVKKNTFVCEGENREAGYVWRMTSGKIPREFRVIESCGEKGFYSPTPWLDWNRKNNTEDSCVNAQIQISFTLGVKSDTVIINNNELNTDNINIFTCEIDEGNKICDENVSDKFKILNITPETIILRKKDGSNLDSNINYRIVLSKNIQSQETVEEFGNNIEMNENLKITRPLSDYNDSAYYFDFKTSNKECLLTGAGINKPSFTTYLLGIVQDDRYTKIYDLDRIFSLNDPYMHPLYYNVYGLGDEACIVLNAENEDWQWGPTNSSSNPATSERSKVEITDIAIAKAWQNYPAGTEIFAQTENTVTTTNDDGDEITQKQTITATSTLYIDLGNPRVEERWPNCIEACINTEIGARFNMIMATNTYENNFELYKCNDGENCSSLGKINSVEGSSDENNLRFYGPLTYLEPATWYLVKLVATSTLGGAPISAVSSIRGSQITLGKNLTGNDSDGNYVWKFRTKDSNAPCALDKVGVDPDPFISTFIGQKIKYTTVCRAAPDSCSPYGQYLNPWNFGWEWKVADEQIATSTQFSFNGKLNSFCDMSCLPNGSDVSYEKFDSSTYYYCGNGVVDPGEDCDIALATETPGLSCGFDCLRPGNSDKSTCGNGSVENNFGEECDLGSANGSNDETCSAICLNKGSSRIETGDVNVSLCGSGGITSGEDCDIAINKIGCSNNCLHTGTSLIQSWCDNYYTKETTAVYSAYKYDFSDLAESIRNKANLACNLATSVCGNGITENGEECDCFNSSIAGSFRENCSEVCSNKCLIKKDVCPIATLAECNPDTQGCSADCSFNGSSLLYSNPSVCGDGFVGIGENPKCELSSSYAGNILGKNPIQIITSLGEVTTVKDFMTTTIKVTSTAMASYDDLGNVSSLNLERPIAGSGNYALQCGFSEKENGDNDCPGNILENNYGVANNSCCFARPERIGQYPYTNSLGVCPNTLLKVSFNRKIDPTSLKVNENIYIIEGINKNESCADDSQDISTEITNYIALKDTGFFTKIWNKIKIFFAKIFGFDDSYASTFPLYFIPKQNNEFGEVNLKNIRWCKTNKIQNISIENDSENYNTTSTLNIKLNNLLTGDAHIFVLLQGGNTNIKDMMGVSIKNPFSTSTLDSWYFKTQTDVCKINQITVDPEEYIFRSPNESKVFEAQALTDKGQAIAPIAGIYNWVWSWMPIENRIFDISGGDIERNTISSKGVEGEISGVLNADITEDISTKNNQVGISFTKLFNLTAYFCSNIWPTDAEVEILGSSSHLNVENKFVNNLFNFDMMYCADNGNPFTKIDDLPRFDKIKVISSPAELGEGYCENNPTISCTQNSNCGESTCIINNLVRYIFFSERTNDVIGIQIFRNDNKYGDKVFSLEEWYKNKFNTNDLGKMQITEIAGYPALTDGKNYYINAFNLNENQVYNNIYLFSVDTGASDDTLNVFEQLINTLRFNINMTDHNVCLANNGNLRSNPSAITAYDCLTDFDCRDSLGQPKNGTIGICSNQKTKFFRDIKRLNDLTAIQTSLDTYFKDTSYNDFKADLQSGSYINNYTNSKWSSWGYLSSLIGGNLPMDPINEWRDCEGYDPLTCWNSASSTFKCPVWSQIYEYEFTSSSPRSYKFYAPLEFFNSSQDNNFLSKYIDLNKIKVSERYCIDDTRNAYTGVCGDGVINKNSGEECEIGQAKVVYSYYDKTGLKTCSSGQYSKATCDKNCKWNYSACTSIVSDSYCGDGIIQKPNGEGMTESCDDGAKNGQYGSKCGSDCRTKTVAQYCGNNQIDYIEKNGTNGYNLGDTLLEKCESINGICNYVSQTGVIKTPVETIKPRVHILLDISGSMAGSRWTSILHTLNTFVDSNKNIINFSLGVFGKNSGSQVEDYCPETNLKDHSCLYLCDNKTQPTKYINTFLTALNSIVPNTWTPTGQALKDLNENIDSIADLNGENLPIVFLITDGNPQKDAYSSTSAFIAEEINLATSSLSNLYLDKGVKTFVLGFDGISNANMNAFAKAGGTDIPYRVSDTNTIIKIFEKIFGCKTYSPVSKYYTCSYDCQSFGEYCGDGIIQWSESETCDDGNRINDDSCLNNCTINTSYIGVCGNGIKEDGEACDLGTSQNGKAGSVCTNDCQIVVGSENICGNGIIEKTNNEQCDLGGLNGNVCTIQSGNESCYYCSKNCQVMVKE
ncbi:MAG: VWA domain-containing protein [Patescibacteria group bacterium]